MKKLLVLILLLVSFAALSQSHSSFSQEDVVTTTNATETQVFGFTIDPDVSGYIIFNVVCQRASDGATKAWALRGSFKKVGSANVVVAEELLGPVTGLSGDKVALLLATASIQTDTDNINIKVKGLASTTIYWYANVEVHKLSN